MSSKPELNSLWNVEILQQAAVNAFLKLTPRQQWKNPVMFVVYLGCLLTTVLWLQALSGNSEEPSRFILSITFW